jgi:hyaluronoglucosaminidase
MVDREPGSGPNGESWLGAVEGYYGPPLKHHERIELVEWLGSHGFNGYAYGPKDDPFHRQSWRHPYPLDQEKEFEELIATGERSGVTVALGVSPGLDWTAGDEAHLVAKLSQFRRLGARALAIAWDDVPPGGGELGEAHGMAVAHAVQELDDDLLWIAVPTDYSGVTATEYLKAFADVVPKNVQVAWTGPGIVSPEVTGSQAASLAAELGRKLLFAENFPVNDGAMGGVLHLGPYPPRPPDLVEETSGVFCNFMSMALASRVGLALAARFWRDPSSDRLVAWRETLEEFPGLMPLAIASRSWVSSPDPDPELLAWAGAAINGDDALLTYLQAGCRSGLNRRLSEEIEPWLDQWEREANAMQAAIALLNGPQSQTIDLAFLTATLWYIARHSREQLFGIRWAYYPVTERKGESLVPRSEALIVGENLTDRLCSKALAGDHPKKRL